MGQEESRRGYPCANFRRKASKERGKEIAQGQIAQPYSF
jgi:hypothetical protein